MSSDCSSTLDFGNGVRTVANGAERDPERIADVETALSWLRREMVRATPPIQGCASVPVCVCCYTDSFIYSFQPPEDCMPAICS